MKRYHKFTFSITTILVILFCWTFTFGASNEIEFQDPVLRSKYYFQLFTFVLLSLIFSTILLWKLMDNMKDKINVLAFFIVIFSIVLIKFIRHNFLEQNWVTQKTVAIDTSQNTQVLIQYRRFWLGGSEKRIVKVKPYLYFFLEFQNADLRKYKNE